MVPKKLFSCGKYLSLAKQAGPYKITGTIDNICFYKMDGQYYARQKSSLTGKRVKKDPAFAGTMREAGLFGRASSLASVIKRSFPKEQQCRDLYQELMRKVKRLMIEGVATEEIKQQLCFKCKEETTCTADKELLTTVKNSSYRSVFILPDLYVVHSRKNTRLLTSRKTNKLLMMGYSPP